MVFELQKGYTNWSTLRIYKITLQTQLKALPDLLGPKYRARARDERIYVLIPAQRTRAIALDGLTSLRYLVRPQFPILWAEGEEEREGNFAAIFR